MKDSATQIEEEVDKTKTELHRHKMEMNKLKDKLSRMDKNDPHYVSYVIGHIHIQKYSHMGCFYSIILVPTQDGANPTLWVE